MKKCSLEELLKTYRQKTYSEQYAHIMKLIDSGQIKPIASAGTNGKKPALPLKFWWLQEQDFSDLKQELLYNLSPMISHDYYVKNLAVYAKERKAVQQMSQYFKTQPDLTIPISLNERSYAIWKQEKFWQKDGGKTILKHCGLSEDKLNFYTTSEPFAYYTVHKQVTQTVLIIENKDTFYSMRRHFLAGKRTIFGQPIGTLIYGAGKRVWSTFKEFQLSAEPYLLDERNNFVYFGDLDYEGILIYEKLAQSFREYREIKPFVPAYEAMLAKEGEIAKLPCAKDGQNHHIDNIFFSYFSISCRNTMVEILEAGRYIPQECLNIMDF